MSWISVKDRLPNDGDFVDIKYEDKGELKKYCGVNFSAKENTFYIDYDFLDLTEWVTHWRLRQ